MSNYAITVTGTTWDGSTSTLEPGTTQFTPDLNFTQTGVLAVIPTVDATNASGNGVNPLDVGLFVGSTLATIPAAGSLAWTSNSSIDIGFLHANGSQKADIDDALTSWNPTTRTLGLAVDPRLAPTIQLNDFDKTGGLLGFPSPILAGELTLTFAPDNSTVIGTATFFGGGYIEPTTAAWTGTFTGKLVS